MKPRGRGSLLAGGGYRAGMRAGSHAVTRFMPHGDLPTPLPCKLYFRDRGEGGITPIPRKVSAPEGEGLDSPPRGIARSVCSRSDAVPASGSLVLGRRFDLDLARSAALVVRRMVASALMDLSIHAVTCRTGLLDFSHLGHHFHLVGLADG